MKLRTKSVIVIVIVAFLIFSALHVVAVFVIQPSFKNIENQDIQQSLSQAMGTINYRLAQMERSVSDYASWDDTYTFVQDRNQEYIENNFMETTFENLNLNFIAIVDNNREIVYCQSFDLNNQTKLETLDETKNILKSDLGLWAFPSIDEQISGIAFLENHPMFVATAPILNSFNQGPAMGSVLFGRYIDEYEIEKLKEIMNLNFSIETLANFELNDKQIAASLLTNPQKILVKENSLDLVSGYLLINDFDSNPTFVLQVSQERVAYQQGLWVEYIFLAASLLLAIVMGLTLILLLEKSVIKNMTKLAANLETMPLNPEVTESKSKLGTDEIAIIAQAMSDNLNKKFEAMNEVSRMVAHDLRNPLTGIKGAAYYLKHSQTDLSDTDKMMLQTIDDCVEYSNKIVSDLLEYSCDIKLDKIETSLKRLVTVSLSTLVVPHNVEVINNVNEDFTVSIDNIKIGRVFGNLIKNAFDAMPNGGNLTITSKKVNEYVRLDFSDTGEGMSKEVLKKLWTPFFTTKAKGMGVGLSICKRLIEAHGGRIEADSTEGKGTTFTIFLPLTTKQKQNET